VIGDVGECVHPMSTVESSRNLVFAAACSRLVLRYGLFGRVDEISV
jgi:hypothetical protein